MIPNKKIKIEKLIFGGQALGRLDGMVVFCWNALPGEEVLVRIENEKRSYLEGVAEKIITPSKHRIEPKEEHFLCCSPWQILDFNEENVWKKKIALEVFRGIEGINDKSEPDIVFDESGEFHYRNKVEYRFTKDSNEMISLALYERGSNRSIPVKECILVEKEINDSAKTILDWLNQISPDVTLLKSLVLKSDGEGRVIAALYLNGIFEFSGHPELNEHLVGFHVFNVKCRNSGFVEFSTVFETGEKSLVSDLLGAKLKFGINSFFQVNLPLFRIALKDISGFIDPKKLAYDCYAGVGAISIPLASRALGYTLIESSRESAFYAESNIDLNSTINCSVQCGDVENKIRGLGSSNIVILDPPRPGLSNKIVNMMLDIAPARLIYLSCNLSSQARDLKKLISKYKISFIRLYNFFPRTPHIESLVVLDKR